jgi:anti-anti-sigma factor
MSTLLSVEIFDEASATRVAVRGELDLSTVGQLRAALAPVLDGAAEGEITIDLSELDFMDSSGIHLLLEAAAAVRATGRSIVLARPSRAVRRVLDAVRLSDHVPIVEDSGARPA